MDEQKVQSAIEAVKLGMSPKEFTIMEEIKGIHKTLKEIANKEDQPFPEIPLMPEIPETDMTETNDLLKQLIEKESVIEAPVVNVPPVNMSKIENLLTQLVNKEQKEVDVTVQLKIV